MEASLNRSHYVYLYVVSQTETAAWIRELCQYQYIGAYLWLVVMLCLK